MEEKDIFSYITTEETNFKTARVPLTSSKDWNMSEHIERCFNVANAWFHKGQNDGLRPYDDIVTPIIDVAFRSEGFDVKDIVPYVDDVNENYKSFLIKKFHPQWARKHELDTFIDDVVETSIIYDLALIKDINNIRPEVVDLKTIAFCDQTDVMAGPICIKHQYTIAELVEFKGKWEDDKIDQAILMAVAERDNPIAGDQKTKTPSKYITVYELRGNLPENWLEDNGEKYKYVPQMHLVCFYTSKEGEKNGITLYKGKDKPLADNFKALKIDRIRSSGRACGRSIVERLFEPQVWNNYSAIKLKKMLDSAVNLLISDSDELGNQKLSELKDNTILKQEKGATTQRLDGSLQNITHFQNYQAKQENSARMLGSASEASLGKNPVSGTPFALQDLIVQQGEGIHEYRRGKIATFFADVLYRDLILRYLVDEMNGGKDFSEELSLDEITEIAETISRNEVDKRIKKQILETGKVPTEEDRTIMRETIKDDIVSGRTSMYKDGRGFMKVLKGELSNVPITVKVNVAGKQKYMAQNADKLSKLISNILQNPQAFAQIPGLGKAYNQLLEESGMNPIDFSKIITEVGATPPPSGKITSPVGSEELSEEIKK